MKTILMVVKSLSENGAGGLMFSMVLIRSWVVSGFDIYPSLYGHLDIILRAPIYRFDI